MKNIKLLFIMILVFVILVSSSYFILKPKISAYSALSEEKCNQLGDDCWHSLAHQTLNKSFCYKIIDNETKEHCLENIRG